MVPGVVIRHHIHLELQSSKLTIIYNQQGISILR